MTNKKNSVLYTGVTNNVLRRMAEHRNGSSANSFTKKYNVNKLVYYEMFNDIRVAIAREKQIKAGSRQKKIDLINSMNLKWEDLSGEFDI